LSNCELAKADFWFLAENIGGNERKGSLYPSSIHSITGLEAFNTVFQNSIAPLSLPWTSIICSVFFF